MVLLTHVNLVLWVLIYSTPHVVGHGRLIEPASRSSMWRYGFKNPINYADNQLYCGGFMKLWSTPEGKCGVCGDPFDGPRENEAGGRYANGIIARHYSTGQVIEVKVELTAHHKGWFEFRLCPNNNPNKKITHKCLDQHLLPIGTTTETRYYVPKGSESWNFFNIKIKLPDNLSCSQCVLQWKYNAGNSWGTDANGRSCVGCGPQEQFYGCADVAIASSDTNVIDPPATAKSQQPKKYRSPLGRILRPKTHSYPGRVAAVAMHDGVVELNKASLPALTTQDTTTPDAQNPTTVTAIESTHRQLRTQKTVVDTNRPSVIRTAQFSQRAQTVQNTNPVQQTQYTNDLIVLRETTVSPENIGQSCMAYGIWKKVDGMNNWCYLNCNNKPRYCPPSHCICS